MVRRRVLAIPRGTQSFESRYPGKRRIVDENLPQLSSWRSNLVRALHDRAQMER